jgi:hypothetical protein
MSAPNDFVSILADLDEGNVSNHLTEQLRRVTLAVLDTGKDGDVTLKIKVTKEARMLLLKALVTMKVPQADTEATLFFADKQGYLQKDDPLQVPLKGVTPKSPTPLRSVETTGKEA